LDNKRQQLIVPVEINGNNIDKVARSTRVCLSLSLRLSVCLSTLLRCFLVVYSMNSHVGGISGIHCGFCYGSRSDDGLLIVGFDTVQRVFCEDSKLMSYETGSK